MLKMIRNTSLISILLLGFLFASMTYAQEVNDEVAADGDALSHPPADRRLDLEAASEFGGEYGEEEGRSPRGFLAALFGYPDDFENVAPAASQPKAVAVEAPPGFRGGNARHLSAKRLPSMVKAVSTTAPKTTTSKTSMTAKKTTTGVAATTPRTEEKAEGGADEDGQNATVADNEVRLDNDTESANNGTDSDDLDVAASVGSSGNSTNGTEGSSGNKREARPSGRSALDGRPPRGPMPLDRNPFPGGHPLPAGYILWHPVPAPFFGGPDIPELPQSSENSPVLVPPQGGRGGGGGPAPFMPHRPFFVEPLPGSFPNPGPFPITQFSSPPVFAVSPDDVRNNDNNNNNRERNNKKQRKGGKSKNRSKGRPNNQDSEEQAGNEELPPPGMRRPVHVLLPPIPPNDFHGGPNFNQGIPQQQFRPHGGGEGGPFRPHSAQFENQHPNQPLRRPPFDQQQLQSQNANNFGDPFLGNNFNNNEFRGQGNNNNFHGAQGDDGFRGPPNSNGFRGPFSENNDFRGKFRGPPNGNFRDQFDGPQGEQQSEKPRRPSPSPSAHPAKFEIDHQKKLEEEFEKGHEDHQRPLDSLPPFNLPPLPPIPPPANFPLPDFHQQQFPFPPTLPPFAFSSPPPQFLDAHPDGGHAFRGPSFRPNPLPSPPPHSSHSSFTTAAPPPKPSPSASLHAVPPLSLPPAASTPFPTRDFEQFSTPQTLTDEEFAAEDGLIYTRDFKKQKDEVRPTSESPFPVFSSAARQPSSDIEQTSHFGLPRQHVQRFPAIPNDATSFAHSNHFNERPAQQNNFRTNQDQRPSSSNRHRVSRPNTLPNTHPNLPDLQTELRTTERHTQTTTGNPEVQSADDSSTASSFTVPRDNYASPGFHTGHKGYPSSVTPATFEGYGFSTTGAPRHNPTSKPRERFPSSTQRSQSNRQNVYGTTFRSSFSSSAAAGSKNKAEPDYHYEIQYQSPVPSVASYTTAKPLTSGSSSTATSRAETQSQSNSASQSPPPFGVESAPEYAAPTFQPAQSQGGSYKPGTSRILLQMNKWNDKKTAQEDSVIAQESHPYLQPSQ